MSKKKQQRIYLLYDSNSYIYEWQTRYYEPDEYDHRSLTIIDIPTKK